MPPPSILALSRREPATSQRTGKVGFGSVYAPPNHWHSGSRTTLVSAERVTIYFTRLSARPFAARAAGHRTEPFCHDAVNPVSIRHNARARHRLRCSLRPHRADTFRACTSAIVPGARAVGGRSRPPNPPRDGFRGNRCSTGRRTIRSIRPHRSCSRADRRRELRHGRTPRSRGGHADPCDLSRGDHSASYGQFLGDDQRPGYAMSANSPRNIDPRTINRDRL